jgi:hypothetical protein
MIESLELNVLRILANPDHELHHQAARFVGYCEQLFTATQGQEFLHFLCSLAHPLRHIPCPDAQSAAHLAGRSEVTALLFRFGCPKSIPILPAIVPKLANTNNKPEDPLWQTSPKKNAKDVPRQQPPLPKQPYPPKATRRKKPEY